MRFAILMDKTATGFSAHVPDLPGCVAAGETQEETMQLIRDAIEFHIEEMRKMARPFPSRPRRLNTSRSAPCHRERQKHRQPLRHSVYVRHLPAEYYAICHRAARDGPEQTALWTSSRHRATRGIDGLYRRMIKPRSEILNSPLLLEWPTGGSASGLTPDEVRVWVVELDAGLDRQGDVDSAEPGPELALLAADEHERAVRFVRARDRRRFVRCRAALREILGEILGEPPASLRFRAAKQGKPELDLTGDSPATAGRADSRFNVSHSSELALIAVSWGRELGVDLERVRPIGEADRIVASFFSPAEQIEFTAIADDARPLAFLRGWTPQGGDPQGARHWTRRACGPLRNPVRDKRSDASISSGGPIAPGRRVAALGGRTPCRFRRRLGRSRSMIRRFPADGFPGRRFDRPVRPVRLFLHPLAAEIGRVDEWRPVWGLPTSGRALPREV